MQFPAIESVVKQGKKINRERGQVINTSSGINGLNLLVEGYVKRYSIKNNGAISIQGIYGPNYFFPGAPIFELLFQYDIEHGEQYYYECITSSVFYSISFDEFHRALNGENGPVIYREMLSETGKVLEYYINNSKNNSLDGAYERVAQQIVFFHQQFATNPEDENKIPVPLRHQDLADMLNMSRETISKQLSLLHGAGLIDSSKCIVINDLNGLIDIYS